LQIINAKKIRIKKEIKYYIITKSKGKKIHISHHHGSMTPPYTPTPRNFGCQNIADFQRPAETGTNGGGSGMNWA